MRTLVFASLTALVGAGAVGAAAYNVVLRDGLAANRPPGRMETVVAHRIVWLSIPAKQRQAANPYRGDPGAANGAGDTFMSECAMCHDADGRGRTGIGQAMYPPVPDLSGEDVQTLSDGALFSIVRNGVRWTGMPAFASHLGADETWKLVALVRRMGAERTAGQPRE